MLQLFISCRVMTSAMLSLLFCFIALSAHSAPLKIADDEITASASVNTSRIFVGERFILNVEVSGPSMVRVSRPELPEIEGLRLLSPIPTSTNSFSLVNGVATSTSGYRFTLQADQPGTITIPAIELEAGGRIYRTNEISLEVLDRDQMQQHHQEDRDVYLRLELSNETPFAGEQVNAKVVLYFKSEISVTSYQPAASWRTEGFWTERLTDGRGPRAETVIINGIQYRRAVLMSYALFPTRSGTVSLGSYRVSVNLRPTSRFGDTSRFFDGFGRTQRSVDLQTEAMELNVKQLPQPQPIGFTGAVGNFSVSRTVARSEVVIGEPLEIETRFSGKGNINLINQPQYEIPAGYERFRPSEQTDIRNTPEGIEGTKTFTDTWIARRVGNFTLPAARVYWFDPDAARYRYRELPEVQLAVLRDPDQEFLFVEDTRIRLNPATGVANWIQAGAGVQNRRLWYLILGILPVLVLSAGYARRRYLDRLQTDRAFMRSRKATQTASARLAQADEQAAGEAWKNAFHHLYISVTGFISDRLNLSETGLSNAYLVSKVREQNADQALLNRLDRFLSHMSDITYAPGEGRLSWQQDRAEAEALIELLKRNLK